VGLPVETEALELEDTTLSGAFMPPPNVLKFTASL
jgi:hypothetical protein